MREDHKIRKHLHASMKESVNVKQFTESADSRFHKAMNQIVDNITVHYAIPEEKVLLQNSENNGEMYVILNGDFDVQS